MQAPNPIMLALVFLIGLSIIFSSAKKDEQKTREYLAKHPTTEPAMVQGEPGCGAWLLVVVIAAVGIYAAMPHH